MAETRLACSLRVRVRVRIATRRHRTLAKYGRNIALAPKSTHVRSQISPMPPIAGHHFCSVAGASALAQSDSCGRGDTQTLPVITTLPQLEDAGGGPRCASVRLSGGGSSSSPTHHEAMPSHRPTNCSQIQGDHFTCSSNSMRD
eukprot:CAMPEP_0118817094 /NCGR_PEP_ID=MMETSP1162-20130426/5188_1 /TAXON_ID=33656 /ORGANISM="Phaeocystis Sp, Strain CCMP2710" /LENGTH=143 /DNA_ID=CAMNT_0006747167 /DNA_START=221 /DNA_END=651 /DNA_ORIENTATION=+